MSYLSLIPWVVLFCIGMAVIILKSKKSTNIDNESYYFSNRSLSSSWLAATLLATQVGGGMLIGVCDSAYQVGLVGFAYPVSQMFGLILVFLFFSKKIKALNLQTAPEIFSKVYQLPKIRKLASLIAGISLFLILIAQVVAIRKLLISLGVDNGFVLVGIWTMVVAYTALGGFGIVVKTDMLQIGFIFLGMFLLYIFTPEVSINIFSKGDILTPSFNGLEMINLLVWPCAYMLIEQDMIQRYVSSNSTGSLNKAIWLSCIGLIGAAMVPVIIGILANQTNMMLSPDASVLLSYVKLNGANWLYNLTLFVLFMAVISTIDSILCALSSLISIDELMPVNIKSSYVRNSLITAVIGFFALIGAYFADSVLKTLVVSYGITASCLCVPVVFGILGFQRCQRAALLAFWCGILGYLVLIIVVPEYSFAAMGVSLLGFGLGYVLDKYKKSIGYTLNTVKLDL